MVVFCAGFILYKPYEKEYDHAKYSAIGNSKARQI